MVLRCSHGSEHPFAEETRLSLGKLPRGRSFIAYSHPTADDHHPQHYDVQGHLEIAALQVLTYRGKRTFISVDRWVFWLVCGLD